MKKITLSVLAVLLLASLVIHGQNGTFSKSYSGIKEVNINIQNGELEITKSISGELEISGNYDAARLKIKADQMGDKLMVKEDNNRLKSNTVSKWVVAVPDGTGLTFNIGAGEVSVDGVKGDLGGNTGSGNFNLKNADCTLNFNTGSGSINVQGSKGEFKVNSGTGNIVFNNSEGIFTANTGTGDVHFENAAGQLSANTGTGDVKATEVSIRKASSFNSGTGNVVVSLGGELNADLNLNAGSNNSSLDFKGHAFKGTLTMSCNKKDGDIISPFGFDEEREENATVYKTKRFGESGIEVNVGVGKGKAKVEK